MQAGKVQEIQKGKFKGKAVKVQEEFLHGKGVVRNWKGQGMTGRGTQWSGVGDKVGIRPSLVSEGFSNLNNSGILRETLEVAPTAPLVPVPEFRHPSRVSALGFCSGGNIQELLNHCRGLGMVQLRAQ